MCKFVLTSPEYYYEFDFIIYTGAKIHVCYVKSMMDNSHSCIKMACANAYYNVIVLRPTPNNFRLLRYESAIILAASL